MNTSTLGHASAALDTQLAQYEYFATSLARRDVSGLNLASVTGLMQGHLEVLPDVIKTGRILASFGEVENALELVRGFVGGAILAATQIHFGMGREYEEVVTALYQGKSDRRIRDFKRCGLYLFAAVLLDKGHPRAVMVPTMNSEELRVLLGTISLQDCVHWLKEKKIRTYDTLQRKLGLRSPNDVTSDSVVSQFENNIGKLSPEDRKDAINRIQSKFSIQPINTPQSSESPEAESTKTEMPPVETKQESPVSFSGAESKESQNAAKVSQPQSEWPELLKRLEQTINETPLEECSQKLDELAKFIPSRQQPTDGSIGGLISAKLAASSDAERVQIIGQLRNELRTVLWGGNALISEMLCQLEALPPKEAIAFAADVFNSVQKFIKTIRAREAQQGKSKLTK